VTEAYAYDDPEAAPMPPEEASAPIYLGQQPKGPPKAVLKLLKALQETNLAEDLDASTLTNLGAKVCEEFKIDEDSRTAVGWDQRNKAAMDLAMLVSEEKSYPWPKSSNVKYPTLATAAIQFNARAYPAVIDGSNIVKGKVLGQSTPEKQERADRVGRYMSYQLLEEMDGWEEDTDRLLMILPITGTVHRKTWFDPVKGCNASQIVLSDKFVVNYWTRSLDAAPRATHVLDDIYPHQIKERIRARLWLEHDYGQPMDHPANDDDAPRTYLEQHRWVDLDDDDYPEPYIVTVHKESQKVVRIVPRYGETSAEEGSEGAYAASIVYRGAKIVRIRPERCFTKYGFIPAPDGSYYDIGFGTLLAPMSETINSTINQLMDAGHLANTGGGFLGNGASLKAGNLRFVPGEWKKVEVTGSTLRESVVPLPVTPPNPVLLSLLELLIESTKDVTATQDILTGDTVQSNQPVGTTLAMIEQGLKTFTAIVKRIHRALKQELGCLYRLNGLYLQPQTYFTFQDVQGVVAQEDFATDDLDVVPVSDPTMATDMQRLGRAQFLMQFRADPLMNGQEINKRVLEAASIDDIQGLFAKEQQPDPKVVIEAVKAHQKDRELALKEEQGRAEVANTDAQTQQIMAQIAMMGPDFILQLQQLIDQREATLLGAQQDQADGQVQSGDPGGMAQSPPDGDFPPVPQGPPGQLGPPMGPGPDDGGGMPGPGPIDGGVGGPQF
jgi:chaperonin GroES